MKSCIKYSSDKLRKELGELANNAGTVGSAFGRCEVAWEVCVADEVFDFTVDAVKGPGNGCAWKTLEDRTANEVGVVVSRNNFADELGNACEWSGCGGEFLIGVADSNQPTIGEDETIGSVGILVVGDDEAEVEIARRASAFESFFSDVGIKEAADIGEHSNIGWRWDHVSFQPNFQKKRTIVDVRQKAREGGRFGEGEDVQPLFGSLIGAN